MHIVAVAWVFVVLLMSLAEATSSQGTVLGAFFTFVLYGVLPLSIVLYLMGTAGRRRARLAAEAPPAAKAGESPSSPQSNGSSQAPREAVATERKEA
jgi:hypothetical protein